MNRKRKIITFIILAVVMALAFPTIAIAVTESDVQAQVAARGGEAVTGNVFIWFLCAVAFLKISQKIDSFMSSLGINVGNTGGSMIAELLIASKGIAAGRNIFGGGGFGTHGASGSNGASGASGSSGTHGGSGFMSGGLAGVVGRSFNRGAVKTATSGEGGGIGGAMFTSSVSKGGEYANTITGDVAKGSINTTGTITGEPAVKAFNSFIGNTAQTGSTNVSRGSSADTPMGMADASPAFVNLSGPHKETPASTSAFGSPTGSPSGTPDTSPAFGSSFGYDDAFTSPDVAPSSTPTYSDVSGSPTSMPDSSSVYGGTASPPDSIQTVSNVEIGGGRITGMEISADSPDGIQFRMYNTEQYMAPESHHETVSAADGSLWYKQYAQDTVEKTPYMAPDGSIAYNESIVKKLPDMPRRKDRV